VKIEEIANKRRGPNINRKRLRKKINESLKGAQCALRIENNLKIFSRTQHYIDNEIIQRKVARAWRGRGGRGGGGHHNEILSREAPIDSPQVSFLIVTGPSSFFIPE
jgi:hypothetical protein